MTTGRDGCCGDGSTPEASGFPIRQLSTCRCDRSAADVRWAPAVSSSLAVCPGVGPIVLAQPVHPPADDALQKAQSVRHACNVRGGVLRCGLLFLGRICVFVPAHPACQIAGRYPARTLIGSPTVRLSSYVRTPLAVKGHWKVPSGGHEKCPLVAIRSAARGRCVRTRTGCSRDLFQVDGLVDGRGYRRSVACPSCRPRSTCTPTSPTRRSPGRLRRSSMNCRTGSSRGRATGS
jgi:hypothetical protein